MFGRQVVQADIAPLSDIPFETEVTLRALPGLRTLSCTSSLQRMQRTRERVADGDDDLALLINGGGALAPSLRGREASLGAGDAVLTLNAEPSAMIYSDVSIALLVPRKALATLVKDPEDMAMQLIPQSNDALRLLTGYLEIMRNDLDDSARDAPAGHDPCLRPHGDGGCVTRDGAAIAEERGMRAARLAAVKADVLVHAGDPGLTLTAVAARQGISPRSVQLLFESEGITFSQFVLEQRLTRAYRMLTDARHGGSTISAIALAAGFGDLSHFHRSFRRRYGATPSDVRAANFGKN